MEDTPVDFGYILGKITGRGKSEPDNIRENCGGLYVAFVEKGVSFVH